MKRIYYWMPELITLFLAAICRTSSAIRFLPVLLVISVMKLFWLSRNGFDTEQFSAKYLFLNAASFLFELGALAQVFSGIAAERSILVDTAVIAVGIAATAISIRMVKNHKQQIQQHSLFVWLTLFGTAISGFVLWRMLADFDAGNSTYNWITLFGVSVQLSELLKIWAIAAAAHAAVQCRRISAAIWIFYIFMLMLVIGLGVVIREWGTAMQFTVFALLFGYFVSPPVTEERRISLLNSRFVPAALGCAMGIGLFILKRVLQYCSSLPEPSETLLSMNGRFNSADEQILEARAKILLTPLIRTNLTEYNGFIIGAESSVLTDYCYATMCDIYGLLLPTAAIGMFAVGLIIVFLSLHSHRRSRYSSAAGTAAAVILLVQMYITIFSVLGYFPFTGITLPFASPGKSSLLISSALVTIMTYAIQEER